MTSDIDGGVAVVDGDGSVAWRVALNETDLDDTPGWDAPVVAAFDADRRPEVLVGSNGGPAMLSAAGTVEWTRDGPGTCVAAARTDGDTAIELFAADTSSVRAYDGASGATEWTRPLTNGRVRTVTAADDDGRAEVLVRYGDGRVVALDYAS